MSLNPSPSAADDGLFEELAETLAPHLLLVRLLGQGGMGLVYLARDPALKRLVAVKVLSPRLARDETARKRFAREAETMAAISHPHIVGVYQVGELRRSGTSYFVMQYVNGAALREEFPRGVPVAEGRSRRCLGEIASALAAAHRLGVVHRDIKPANVMLDRESGRYLVLDFGISAVLPSADAGSEEDRVVTSDSIRVGTPLYMSPEQASGGEVSGKGDVYSLGCMAYELLTGELPFKGRSPMEVFASHILVEPPKVSAKRPELDRQFADLVDRCLAKRPEARPSAEELTRALLPSLKAVVEWPPPGLEPLRGLGGLWTKRAAFLAVTGMTFFIELMMQPTVSRTCCWRAAESSRLWEVLKRLSHATPIHFDDPDAMSVWYFLLDVTFIFLLFCIPLVVIHSWRLTVRLHQGRRAGYPWRALLDVAWDDYPDTTDLLNGTGRYSLFGEADRAQARSLRRLRSSLMVTAVLLALAAPTLWLHAGGYVHWSHRAPVFGIADALVLWSLPTLALLWMLLANMVGWRRKPGRRLQLSVTHASAAEIRRELVSVWLLSAGQRPPASRRALPAWALLAVPSTLVIALVLTVVIVLSVVFKSTARMVASAAEAREWIQKAATSPAGDRVDPPSTLAALALVTAPAEWEPELAPIVDLSEARRLHLAPAEHVAYCLNAREVLFGPSGGRLSLYSSSRFRGPRLDDWRGRALEVVGFGGLVHRSAYCSVVLGSDVSTVEQLP